MRELPIIFNGPMVQAILDNRKTQTRRVIKPQPTHFHKFDDGMLRPCKNKPEPCKGPTCGGEIKCPYGQPDDLLYIRETNYRYGAWAMNGRTKTGKQKWKFFALNEDVRYFDNPPAVICTGRNAIGWYKRPAIFLPKKLTRLWLEKTNGKVEYVQDISEEDAKAEGVKPSETIENTDGSPCYTAEFQRLWTILHGIDNPKSWESNPMVWVEEFRKADRP